MRAMIAALTLIAATSVALADDLQPTVEATSGNWVAASFNDGTDTKICVAGSADKRLLFRADANDLEVRTADDSWSLSAGLTGEMKVKVGNVEKVAQMQTFNATTLAGIMQPSDVSQLMDAMDKAPSALVTFGSKKTISVSLMGSTRVMNAFRTCAGVHGFASLGASTGNAASPF